MAEAGDLLVTPAWLAEHLEDPHAPVAFTLASPERFARVMETLGIGDESEVVPSDELSRPRGR